MIQVSCALIIKQGKVLITQNGGASDHPYQWEFPGGKIKPGETKEAAIIREISEELDVNIKVNESLIPVDHDYGIKQIKLIPFVCSIADGILKLNNHISHKWVALHKLEDIDFSDADKRLIRIEENCKLLQKYSGK